MTLCLISLIETGAGIASPSLTKATINCSVSNFDYKVNNIDHSDYFAFRMGMVAFKVITTILSIIVLGIVWHYERYGGDPQKRTILNQLIGMMAWNNLTVQVVAAMSLLFRLLFGQLPMEVVMVTFVAPNVISSLFILFILNEIIIVRCYTLVLLKQLPPINDDFFATFIQCLNYTLGVMFVSMGRLGGISYDNLVYFMTGEYFNKEPLLSAAR